jgi:nucleotide-binding universal stress UspA family protein
VHIDERGRWRRAMPEAIAMARMHGGTLTLTAIMADVPASGSIHMMVGGQLGLRESQGRLAQRMLAAAVEEIPMDISCETRIVFGRAAPVLLRSAASGRYSLVLGPGSRFARWVLRIFAVVTSHDRKPALARIHR